MLAAEAPSRTPALRDVDAVRIVEAYRLADELGAETVPPDEVYDRPCDIYAPCAIGATLNVSTVPRLRCRAVVGSANNQLEEAADADRLRRAMRPADALLPTRD